MKRRNGSILPSFPTCATLNVTRLTTISSPAITLKADSLYAYHTQTFFSYSKPAADQPIHLEVWLARRAFQQLKKQIKKVARPSRGLATFFVCQYTIKPMLV